MDRAYVNLLQGKTEDQMITLDQLHKHFANLTYWMRNLIISNKYNMENKFDAFARIFEEPENIGNIIEPFIGREKAHQFKDLMTSLITIYHKVINNLLSQNNQDVGANVEEMQKVADELSSYFTGINPRWSKEQWEKILQEWVRLAYEEAQSLFSGNYMGEINLFDQFINQSYQLADHLIGLFFPDFIPSETAVIFKSVSEEASITQINCRREPEFKTGEIVASLAYHPPEITSGTMVTIARPHPVTFYAIMLPDRQLHRWIADFELEDINPRADRELKPGDMAMVISDEGHMAMIKKGMTVRIEKAYDDTYLYDVFLPDGSYHRWLAEFELVRPA